MSEATVAGARVKIGGTPLEEEGQLIEVRVEENLRPAGLLPAPALGRRARARRQFALDVGKTVEVDLGGADSSALGSVFKGEIASLEPVFEQNRAEVAVRGYDDSHQLHRTRRTMTYQNMTPPTSRGRWPRQAGFGLGHVDERRAPRTTSSSRTTRPTGSSSGGSRGRIDFEVLVIDKQAPLPQGAGRPAEPA